MHLIAQWVQLCMWEGPSIWDRSSWQRLREVWLVALHSLVKGLVAFPPAVIEAVMCRVGRMGNTRPGLTAANDRDVGL